MGEGSDGLFVVGIGMSAGGIEALGGLLKHAPADTGMAFVVVSHLPRERQSGLTEIVGRFTSMPVSKAADGDELRADHVYVVPERDGLTVRGGRLRVGDRDPASRGRNPIDAFLATLAEDKGDRAIAVILSGGGSDGSQGVKAVKEVGGLAVAQGFDHSVPRHPSMPFNAIATGLVDMVLPAEQIVGRLAEYVRDFGAAAAATGEIAAAPPDAEAAPADPRREICEILRRQVGHDFSGYKDRTFLRRVQRRMQVLQVGRIEDYVERLRTAPDEVALLFRDLLIGVTYFFRDPDAFAALGELVVPRLLEGKGAGDVVRVWVPGCATGEEVYSIAMLLREQAERLPAAPRFQLFATDISDGALEVARAGRYPAALLEGMPEERLRRFFTGEGESYLLSKQIRDMCVFSSHSVVRDSPFSRIDLVSCRNLLIYLGAEAQSRVIPMFHYALRPGGFLFLGGSENVTEHGDLFAPLDKRHRIFERRDHIASPALFPLLMPGARFPGGGAGPEPRRDHATPAGVSLQRTVEARVLERFAPAHVLVDRTGDVIYFSPRTGKYLEPSVGQPTRQVLALARRGLRLDLRTAMQEAVEGHRAVTRERVAVEVDDRVQVIDLTVEPLPGGGGEPLYLVTFADVGGPLTPEEAARTPRPGDADHTVDQLERELRDTRERLQSMIEEYETALEELKSANEELVSVNEEIQSTNEELETSKEEIQAVNEELHTVNQELGVKLDQLNQANNDLSNLFQDTEIAIVFLDRRLVIRNFTPAAAQVFNLIPADRGRALGDITAHLDHPELHAEIARVAETGRPLEARVGRRDGRKQFLMRVLPYRGTDDVLDGAIVTFFDITRIVEGERAQRTLVHELNHRVRNMLTVVTAIASQTLARTPSPEAFGAAFTGRIEALARAHGLVAREQWGDVGLADMVREELEPHALGDDGEDDAGRVAVEGPPVQMRPKAAVALGMVLHELATNAVKYGALSVAEGSVRVAWAVEDAREGEVLPRLVLRWEERDGPPVAAPGAKGFGSDLIERQVEHELDGSIDVEFATDGVRATIAMPMVDAAPQ